MSSRDRNRTNRQRRPEPAAGSFYSDDVVYDDDVLYDEDWNEAGDYNDEPQTPSRQGARVTRQASPKFQGTASQIDQLRRNIGRAGGTGREDAKRPVQPSANPARLRRPAQQVQQAPSYRDDPYGDPDYRAAPPARSTRRSQPVTPAYERPAPTSAAEPATSYDDQFDDQGYDVYDEYPDDFDEYDAPGRPPRASRPKSQISLPAMSRPALPRAIANADLVNDAPALAIIGIGLASLAAMAILVANQVDGLAPGFATHVSASGILEEFRAGSALWNIPIMATAFTLMNIVIGWFVSPTDRFASRFVLAGALVVQIISWVAIIRIL